MFNLQNLHQQPLAVLQILGILLTSYATRTLLDFIRQALFAVTIGCAARTQIKSCAIRAAVDNTTAARKPKDYSSRSLE